MKTIYQESSYQITEQNHRITHQDICAIYWHSGVRVKQTTSLDKAAICKRYLAPD